jgi:hypothetical protein
MNALKKMLRGIGIESSGPTLPQLSHQALVGRRIPEQSAAHLAQPVHDLVPEVKARGDSVEELPYGRLPLEVPPRECGETHPVHFEFAGCFTESSFSDPR